MAKNPANVKKFLLDLKYKLQKIWSNEKVDKFFCNSNNPEKLDFSI